MYTHTHTHTRFQEVTRKNFKAHLIKVSAFFLRRGSKSSFHFFMGSVSPGPHLPSIPSPALNGAVNEWTEAHLDLWLPWCHFTATIVLGGQNRRTHFTDVTVEDQLRTREVWWRSLSPGWWDWGCWSSIMLYSNAYSPYVSDSCDSIQSVEFSRPEYWSG